MTYYYRRYGYDGTSSATDTGGYYVLPYYDSSSTDYYGTYTYYNPYRPSVTTPSKEELETRRFFRKLDFTLTKFRMMMRSLKYCNYCGKINLAKYMKLRDDKPMCKECFEEYYSCKCCKKTMGHARNFPEDFPSELKLCCDCHQWLIAISDTSDKEFIKEVDHYIDLRTKSGERTARKMIYLKKRFTSKVKREDVCYF